MEEVLRPFGVFLPHGCPCCLPEWPPAALPISSGPLVLAPPTYLPRGCRAASIATAWMRFGTSPILRRCCMTTRSWHALIWLPSRPRVGVGVTLCVWCVCVFVGGAGCLFASFLQACRTMHTRYAVRSILGHFNMMPSTPGSLLTLKHPNKPSNTGEPRHARVARGVLDYLRRDMTHPEGGIFSAEVSHLNAIWMPFKCHLDVI